MLKQATIVMQQTTVEQLYPHSYEPMGLWVSGFCDILNIFKPTLKVPPKICPKERVLLAQLLGVVSG
jgi:hypothetical protein